MPDHPSPIGGGGVISLTIFLGGIFFDLEGIFGFWRYFLLRYYSIQQLIPSIVITTSNVTTSSLEAHHLSQDIKIIPPKNTPFIKNRLSRPRSQKMYRLRQAPNKPVFNKCLFNSFYGSRNALLLFTERSSSRAEAVLSVFTSVGMCFYYS